MAGTETDKLTAAMAAGDAGAVDAFYRQYFAWMYAHARLITKRDESFCLDVVQDAVLRVIRTVKPVDCEKRFRGWLRLVVQTTAFDLLRRETRRKNREAMMGTSQLSVSSDSLQLDWLREQITQMDPELVHIVELRFEQSWTLRRIGEKLGLSIGAVDGRLRRALKNLKLAADESAMPETSVDLLESEPVSVPPRIQKAVMDSDEIRTEPVEIVSKIPPSFIEPMVMSVEPPLITEPAELSTDAVEAAAEQTVSQFEARSSIVETSPIEPVISDAAVEAFVEIEPAAMGIDTAVDSPEVTGPATEVETLVAVEESVIEAPAVPLERVSSETLQVVEMAAFAEAPRARQPVLFEAVSESVATLEIEAPELVGLEDEAGAYDDRI